MRQQTNNDLRSGLRTDLKTVVVGILLLGTIVASLMLLGSQFMRAHREAVNFANDSDRPVMVWLESSYRETRSIPVGARKSAPLTSVRRPLQTRVIVEDAVTGDRLDTIDIRESDRKDGEFTVHFRWPRK
jgi:hypothetical protein